MIKIVMCVRNRLAITRKSIEALYRHTKSPFQLHIYDNISTYKVKDHFQYFWKLYEQGNITKVTFNTEASTYNAFSKAVAINSFGHDHEQDPNKDKCDFITMIDNDMIVTPNWDETVKDISFYIDKHNLNNIFITTQYPGGMKKIIDLPNEYKENKIAIGKLGGSGFWNVKTDFFKKVGYLDIKMLIGQNKRHDQLYWRLLDKASGGENYIIGTDKRLVYHLGGLAGSVCNMLTKHKAQKTKPENTRLKELEFKEVDDKIDKMSFDEFYNMVQRETKYHGW